MPANPPQAGLRARKKERTRHELRDSAARLFAARGFAGTTIADIAAGANVSERTFFRYFDSKEALLLPDGAELFARIEAELATRPAAEPPLDAVGAALLAAARAFGSSGELALAPAPKGTESLVTARLVREFVDFEDRLATLVERRLPPGTPEPGLRAAVLAGAALAAARAVLRTQGERRSAGAAASGSGTSGTGTAGTGASASGAAALLPAALDLLAHLPRIGTIEV